MEMDKKLMHEMAKRPTQNHQQKEFPNHDQAQKLYTIRMEGFSIHVHRIVNLLSYKNPASL